METKKLIDDCFYVEEKKYTGDIMYGENIVPVNRTPGQAENIRFVVKF